MMRVAPSMKLADMRMLIKVEIERHTIAWVADVAWRAVVLVLLVLLAVAQLGCSAFVRDHHTHPSVKIKTSCGAGGSGVIVSGQHVLTAAHVLIGCPSAPVWVVDSDNNWRIMALEHIRPKPDIDVARLVLVAGGSFRATAPEIVTVAVGTLVCAETAHPKRQRVCGKVESSTNRTEGGIRVSFPIEQGNSGSPVYSDRGLVGLVVECDWDPERDTCLTTGGNVTALAGRAVMP